MVKKLVLASPRGFCAGVVRAIDVVRIALDVCPPPIYVRKQIIHNAYVVDELRGEGAIFVDSLDQVPSGGTVIFSAHGVSPQVWADARSRSLKVIDATCPLVTKVHVEAIRYSKRGFTIVLIGHEGHEEVVGTMGEAPDAIVLVSTIDEVEKLEVKDPGKIAYLTQTTLSLEDTKGIIAALRRRFPMIQGPPSEDICYATQNRQLAVRELAAVTDLILVVGSSNSSNSNRLVEEAITSGVPSYLIGDVSKIRQEWLQGVKNVGLTSGASAPEVLVDQVIRYFLRGGAVVEDLVTREENVHFALPPELRQPQSQLHVLP
ncbi:MAG: 4-hydroxy-3-methylbut-2-enyl diphosphate reductase [Candidatus Aminicenantes bacterium]|nr:4-hydroxy-3-methylbut-2-enyl diphosphate reductase [Candidatus Aminicenantes bacterium]